jgi:hypothetical protein
MEMQEGPADDVPGSTELPQTGPLPSWLEPGEPPPFEATAEKELREEMEHQAADVTGDLPEAGFLDDLEAETADETESYGADDPGELSEAEFLEGVKAEVSADEDISEPEPEEEDSERPGIGFAGAAAGIVAGVLGKKEKEETEAPEDSETDIGEAGVEAGMFDQAEGADLSDSAGEFELTEDKLGGTESAPGSEELAAEGTESDGALEGDIPDWMEEAGWGESKGEFEDAPVSFSDHELQSLDAGEIPAEGAAADDDVELTPAELPDWIHDIAPEEVEGSDDGAGDESLPDWIGAEAPSDDEPILDVTPPVVEIEASDEGGETEASAPSAESDTGEIPTWITSEPPGATESIVTWLEDRGPDSEEEDTAASADLPDWMRDTGPLDDSLDSAQIEEQEDVISPAELPMDATVDAEEDAPTAESPMVGELPEEPGSDSRASDRWLSAVAAAAAEDEASPSEPQEEAGEAPDWLSEAMDTPEDSDSDGIGAGADLAAAAAAGLMASKDEEAAEPAATEDSLDEALGLDMEIPSMDKEVEIPDQDKEQDIASFAPAAEAVSDISSSTEETDVSEAEAIDESGASEQDLAAQFGPSDSSSAPDWLEEIGTLPEQPMQTDSADWLEGLEIDGEESPAEPAPDTPDWLKGLAEEGADGDEIAAAPAADWLREIGEPGSVSEEQPAEAGDQPTQDEPAEQVEAAAGGGAPDWLQGVESEQPRDAAPEPDELDVETPPAPAEEDSEVMDWLHDLAAKQAEAPDDEELEATPQAEAATPVLEDREIPDEPEEGLEWLEHLADQRGMDVDVSVPSQTASPPSSPEPESEPESETAPGWLGRMATQPIPKVDMEALEAAARGEEVSPDAETIDAQAADIQAQLDEAALEREGSEDSAEIAPDDITIEAHAGDLPVEIEQDEERISPPVEPVSSPVAPVSSHSESDSEEEIPDWLIAAAEQAEPPSDAPTGLPAEFVETTTDETEVAPEPADLAEFIAATSDEPEVAPEPAVSDEQEISAEPPEDAVAVETAEVEFPEVAEPADLAAADEVEGLDDSETVEVKTAEEAEPAAEESPPPETKKKEDLLERSRQALASGDTRSATEMYGDLVRHKESLDSVIEDLRIAVDRAPDDADLWQVLGDAYMRDDQTDEAIDAYRKGMEAA